MASSFASPSAASFKYLSDNWTLFTFSCSWTSMEPYSRSFSTVIFGCSNSGSFSLEFTSFLPIFSTPTLAIHFLTSSSYALALMAPKKSAHKPNNSLDQSQAIPRFLDFFSMVKSTTTNKKHYLISSCTD